MRKFVLAITVFLVVVSSFYAQSGRRIRKKVTPIQTTVVKPGDTYSESRSYKPLRIYPPNYRKNKKSKSKETKAKPAVVEVDGEDEIIEVDATLVTIPVSIYDRNGIYITNISQKEVKVFEDGVEQELAYFKTSEKPFTVALLIDTSPSTQFKIEQIRRAAKVFVGQLKPNDKVLVMEFDNNPKVLTEATSDREKIYRAIDRADFGSGTALYDAVHVAINKRLNKIKGRKAIVLFTDGVDTVSRKSYGSTMRDAEESGAMIFPIYYDTFRGNAGINGGIINSPFPRNRRAPRNGSSSEEYALGKGYLAELAASTGGRVFRAGSTPGGLTRAFEGIAEELRRQYNVGYYPKRRGKLGERKKIKVRVYRPKLIVRARDSYIVGASK